MLASALYCAGCGQRVDPEILAQHRNLGKAFYENPTTQQEAVVEFQKALELVPDSARERLNYGLALLAAGRDEEAAEQLRRVQKQDPSLPHTWFNLGLLYKQQGELEQALAQFEGMAERARDEPIGHYQLGTLYQALDRIDDARAAYERAAELDPLLAAARFRLSSLSRLSGDAEQASRRLAEFQRIQQLQADWVTPEDVDWCDYAEIYDPPQQRVSAADPPEPSFADQTLSGTLDAPSAGLALIDSRGDGGTDLLAWSRQGIQLYERGRKLIAASGLEAATDVVDLAPGDFDDDGLVDLAVLSSDGAALYRNSAGRFSRVEAELPAGRFNTVVWLDFDHDYDLDLFLLGEHAALARNQGEAGWQDRSADFPFVEGLATAAEKLRVAPDSTAFDLAVSFDDREPVLYRDRLGGRYEVQAFDRNVQAAARQVDADFDGDGLPDRARVDADGGIHLLRNQSESKRNWIRVQLKGVRSLKSAEDALVEVKAGQLYRRAFYRGVPLLLDVADATSVDVVRITWSNGLIQNEINQAVNQDHVYEEKQRLSGSCPMIWTWNGNEFQFITDVLGVAPLGASDGDGSYFAVDHDEYVQIPGQALAAVDGYYEVRITEELSEVAYLDQVALYALDHPAGVEVFTNEKFKGPPFPEFRLFSVAERFAPQAASDDQGRDGLELIASRDRRYPDGFPRSKRGVADLHWLQIDFGAAAPADAVLFLNGWVDWPDGSTFRGASQELKEGLIAPYLQVQDAQGDWVTVNADMGMPAGKPKTISVPLAFLSEQRQVRIVTNFSVYWDEVFLGARSPQAPLTRKQAPLVSADLHFRGFSESLIHPQRKQPDRFFYGRFSPTSFWNPTPGRYTKYGSIRELLERVDDRFAIMASGDEATLRFRAADLGDAPVGWTRDFLLKVDGWAKDHDPNTAYAHTVEPLPFHGMSRYPYPADERYPDDAFHREYQGIYNTRPALVLIRPLEEE